MSDCQMTESHENCEGCAGGDCDAAEGARPGESRQEHEERRALERNLGRIKHKIMVLSGKGGVGKSTVAVNLAVSLSLQGLRVGLLDVDFHGPSVPGMLRLNRESARVENNVIRPVEVGDMKVMSIGLLLNRREDAVIWRGPMKMGIIERFLREVDWGELDYLIVDSPPGTGDEPLSVCQLIEDATGAIVVTTPQQVATDDVRRSITFCRQLSLPVLGVVENMSGFVCPHCGETTDIFTAGGGERMAEELGIAFLGRIPLDPAIGEACDHGTPYIHRAAGSPTAQAFERVIAPILALNDSDSENHPTLQPQTQPKETDLMRIAIPIANGQLAMHFGHCEKFALVDVDPETRQIVSTREVDAPEHQPGLLPPWLAEQGAQTIVAGGMGQSAQSLFAEQGVTVVTGAPALAPKQIVEAYLAGTLPTGENACDH